MVEAMNGSPRFPWLRAYTDVATSSWLALRGALSPSGGRRVAALQAASPREIRAGLQATSMLETSLGGVSALLGDLQASGVAVESGSRAQLLSSALLEGRLQQQRRQARGAPINATKMPSPSRRRGGGGMCRWCTRCARTISALTAPRPSGGKAT